MDFFEKLDDSVIEKINNIKEEIKNDQKEIYAILLEITTSFSDEKKDKNYRDSLFERVDLLNIIIKENNRKINDLKRGEYKDNFNNAILTEKLEETSTELEEISDELKQLEKIKQEMEEEVFEEIKEEVVNESADPIEEIINEVESDIKEDKKELSPIIDIKKELEEIINEVNVAIKEDNITERVPVLFSTTSYTTTNSRRANTQLVVREERESFSEKVKNIFSRIKHLIIK